MLRVILFGAPGCGKGTQARLLEQKYGYRQISTGDLIRAEISAGSAVGNKVRSLVDAGQYVPDEIMIELVNKRVHQPDIENGYIMDGFPRTFEQAKALSGIEVGREIAIYLKVKNEDVVVRRIMSRLTCSRCGAIFNTMNHPSKKPGICDLCGGELQRRTDDNEESIKERIRIYQQQTMPVLEFYRQEGVLHEADASLAVEDVFVKIEGLLN
jgi:adenylate kinase